MTSDFEYFVNRLDLHDVEVDKLGSKTLVLIQDQKWKDMRATLTPIYTSSKLKYMFGLLTECTDNFISIYEKKAKENGSKVEIETHDTFGRINADGIATTALGFKGDCVENKDSEMYKIAKDLDEDFSNPLNFTLCIIFPKIYEWFRMQVFRKSVQDFFFVNVSKEIKRRREGKIIRPDVIQLLLQVKDGELELEDGDVEDFSTTEFKAKKITNWSDEDLAAQAFVLFGGFDTTTTLMQAISFEFAHNPEVQQVLINEVDAMLDELQGNTISYEQVNGMKYLDMVLHEAMRKWPPIVSLGRHCKKDYELVDDETGESYIIKKDSLAMIPLTTIQMDPKYFPDPEKFDPTRFSDENRSKIQSGSYLPFGIGPRMCIGKRYALVGLKLLLFSIISKFKIEKCNKTPEKLTHKRGTSGYEEEVHVILILRKVN